MGLVCHSAAVAIPTCCAKIENKISGGGKNCREKLKYMRNLAIFRSKFLSNCQIILCNDLYQVSNNLHTSRCVARFNTAAYHLYMLQRVFLRWAIAGASTKGLLACNVCALLFQ